MGVNPVHKWAKYYIEKLLLFSIELKFIHLENLHEVPWTSGDTKKENILKHHGKKYTFFSPRVFAPKRSKT